MRSLWKIDNVDGFGAIINLLGYPNLQQLYFNCEPRLGRWHYRGPPPRLTTFDSRLIAHLHKLQTLSLRGYHTVDLLSLPLSLQVDDLSHPLLWSSLPMPLRDSQSKLLHPTVTAVQQACSQWLAGYLSSQCQLLHHNCLAHGCVKLITLENALMHSNAAAVMHQGSNNALPTLNIIYEWIPRMEEYRLL